jgi:hypothetical protein
VTIAASIAVVLVGACSSPYSEDGALTTGDAASDRRQEGGELSPEEAGTLGDGGLPDGEAGETSSSTTASAYAAAVLADDPIAYWRLSDTSTVAVDQTSNQRHGTYLGSCGFGVPGPFPGTTAVDFSGMCQIRGPVIDFANREPFTLEAWAKPRAHADQHQRLFGHGVNTGAGYQHIGVYSRDQFGIVLERSVDSNIIIANAPAPPLGSYVHVAGVYDGSTLMLYINGATSQAMAPDTRSQVAKSAPFWIGSNGDENFFDGALAEAAIYAKALSKQQIESHYAVGMPVK